MDNETESPFARILREQSERHNNEDPRSSDQDTAIERAFVAPAWPFRFGEAEAPGTLAEHHPTVEEPVPPIPSAIANEEISFIKERPDGKKVTTLGSILEDGHH